MTWTDSLTHPCLQLIAPRALTFTIVRLHEHPLPLLQAINQHVFLQVYRHLHLIICCSFLAVSLCRWLAWTSCPCPCPCLCPCPCRCPCPCPCLRDSAWMPVLSLCYLAEASFLSRSTLDSISGVHQHVFSRASAIACAGSASQSSRSVAPSSLHNPPSCAGRSLVL